MGGIEQQGDNSLEQLRTQVSHELGSGKAALEAVEKNVSSLTEHQLTETLEILKRLRDLGWSTE